MVNKLKLKLKAPTKYPFCVLQVFSDMITLIMQMHTQKKRLPIIKHTQSLIITLLYTNKEK